MVDGVPFLSNIENNVLIVAAGETVSAVNRSDGNLIWSFETEGLLKRSAFQQDEVVFVGCWDTNLYALDQRSGDVLWMFDSGWGIETIPVIIGEKVIFGSHDQNVYALDRANGNVLWVFSCKAGIHSDPVIWQDSVVIGSDDGGLYRLNCGTGSEIWCFAPGNTIQDATRNYVTTPIRSSVAVDSDQLFIGVLGRLYSIH
jgi:outer membrane protein assembly factor BamB